MTPKSLNQTQLRDLLLRNWMTHDALWYGEVVQKLGMEAASPMNLRVCRELGRIEYKRLINLVGAAPPTNMNDYRELFDLGRQVFVPDFISIEIDYPKADLQRFRVSECFAHRGMEKAGLLAGYECGIFERICGWLDAMKLAYTLKPSLHRCLKYQGKKCEVTVQFQF